MNTYTEQELTCMKQAYATLDTEIDFDVALKNNDVYTVKGVKSGRLIAYAVVEIDRPEASWHGDYIEAGCYVDTGDILTEAELDAELNRE